MRSELIEGVTRSDLDTHIARFISKHPSGAPPHANMFVAVRNETGGMYRLIIADGVVELMRVAKFLAGIGCVEEFTDEFDALFRVPSDRAKSFSGRRAPRKGIEPQRHE